jgi:hypothetical protein
MSRVFDFVERWFAETEHKRANRDSGKKIPETRRRKRAGGHFENRRLWPTQRGSARRNMDRLYGKRAPIEAALCGKGKNALLAQGEHPAFTI